jgi:acyl carrier protein
MNDLARKVRDIVIGDLGLNGTSLHLDDDLVAHGADELDMQGIAMHLEAEFGIQQLDEEQLNGESTIQKCIEMVQSGLAFA